MPALTLLNDECLRITKGPDQPEFILHALSVLDSSISEWFAFEISLMRL